MIAKNGIKCNGKFLMLFPFDCVNASSHSQHRELYDISRASNLTNSIGLTQNRQKDRQGVPLLFRTHGQNDFALEEKFANFNEHYKGNKLKVFRTKF